MKIATPYFVGLVIDSVSKIILFSEQKRFIKIPRLLRRSASWRRRSNLNTKERLSIRFSPFFGADFKTPRLPYNKTIFSVNFLVKNVYYF
jgi:hypothetical protein